MPPARSHKADTTTVKYDLAVLTKRPRSPVRCASLFISIIPNSLDQYPCIFIRKHQRSFFLSTIKFDTVYFFRPEKWISIAKKYWNKETEYVFARHLLPGKFDLAASREKLMAVSKMAADFQEESKPRICGFIKLTFSETRFRQSGWKLPVNLNIIRNTAALMDVCAKSKIPNEHFNRN